MFSRKKNYLKQIYKQSPKTMRFIIEVSLDNYNEVFNGWDPSPIKRRDIEPELLNYIEQCAYDIPLKYGIELNFHLPKNLYNEKKENLTKVALINNFKFITHFINRKLALYYRKILVYIILSFSFLAAGFLIKQHGNFDVVLTTLIEGLYIGGWVFLWEAFSLFFFSSQETRGKLKRYTRFIDSPVHFYYQ
jgi:hypothetical protein